MIRLFALVLRGLVIKFGVYCLYIHIFAGKYATVLPQAQWNIYMVDNTINETPLLFAPVAERYECLTSNHECGGSNPAEDIIWET